MVAVARNRPQGSVCEQVIDECGADQRLPVTVLVSGALLPQRDRVVDRGLDAQRAVAAVLPGRQVPEQRPEEADVPPVPGQVERALAQSLGGQRVQLGERGHRAPHRVSAPPPQVSSVDRAGSWLVQPVCRGAGYVFPVAPPLLAWSTRAGLTHGSSSSCASAPAEAGRPNVSTSRVTTRPATIAAAARAYGEIRRPARSAYPTVSTSSVAASRLPKIPPRRPYALVPPTSAAPSASPVGTYGSPGATTWVRLLDSAARTPASPASRLDPTIARKATAAAPPPRRRAGSATGRNRPSPRRTGLTRPRNPPNRASAAKPPYQ